uniref:Uncharacterized protein n=1 Tax=Palpitomonas bilix TaxID=652834 RepID=A0A7S3GKL8_9EUKA
MTSFKKTQPIVSFPFFVFPHAFHNLDDMVKRKRESISSLRGKNYDLFIDVDPLDKSKKAVLARETIGKEAERLGYSGCAFVHRVKGRLGAKDENPNGPGVVDSVEEQPGFKQYSRLHLILSDPSQGHNLNMNNQVVRSFDILSVEPKSEKVFTQCCQNLEVDIITINCEDRLPYRLSRSMVKLAIERGISFELCFREPLTDSSTRRFFVSNGVALQRVTKGKPAALPCKSTSTLLQACRKVHFDLFSCNR